MAFITVETCFMLLYVISVSLSFILICLLQAPASEYGNESDHGLTTRHSGSRVSLASLGLRTESRLRSMSVVSAASMRQSMLNLMVVFKLQFNSHQLTLSWIIIADVTHTSWKTFPPCRLCQLQSFDLLLLCSTFLQFLSRIS